MMLLDQISQQNYLDPMRNMKNARAVVPKDFTSRCS